MQTVLNAIGVLTNRTAGVIQAVNGPLEIVANTLSNIGSLTAEDGQQSVSTRGGRRHYDQCAKHA